jgi:hypothetical protein
MYTENQRSVAGNMRRFLIHMLSACLLCVAAPTIASPSIDAILVMPLHERQKLADDWFSEKEFRRAKKQYGILARLGSKHAQNRLAMMNMNGWGMKKDPVQAWVWAALAAEFNEPQYAYYRDEYWKVLSIDQREQAVDELREQMVRLTDMAVAFQLQTKSRQKLRMDTIGYGLLAEGLVKTWRAEGMRGDPANAGGVVNLLHNIHYISREHYEGQRVTLGAFEVLEDEVVPPMKPRNPDDQPD